MQRLFSLFFLFIFYTHHTLYGDDISNTAEFLILNFPKANKILAYEINGNGTLNIDNPNPVTKTLEGGDNIFDMQFVQGVVAEDSGANPMYLFLTGTDKIFRIKGTYNSPLGPDALISSFIEKDNITGDIVSPIAFSPKDSTYFSYTTNTTINGKRRSTIYRRKTYAIDPDNDRSLFTFNHETENATIGFPVFSNNEDHVFVSMNTIKYEDSYSPGQGYGVVDFSGVSFNHYNAGVDSSYGIARMNYINGDSQNNNIFLSTYGNEHAFLVNMNTYDGQTPPRFSFVNNFKATKFNLPNPVFLQGNSFAVSPIGNGYLYTMTVRPTDPNNLTFEKKPPNTNYLFDVEFVKLSLKSGKYSNPGERTDNGLNPRIVVNGSYAYYADSFTPAIYRFKPGVKNSQITSIRIAHTPSNVGRDYFNPFVELMISNDGQTLYCVGSCKSTGSNNTEACITVIDLSKMPDPSEKESEKEIAIDYTQVSTDNEPVRQFIIIPETTVDLSNESLVYSSAPGTAQGNIVNLAYASYPIPYQDTPVVLPNHENPPTPQPPPVTVDEPNKPTAPLDEGQKFPCRTLFVEAKNSVTKFLSQSTASNTVTITLAPLNNNALSTSGTSGIPKGDPIFTQIQLYRGTTLIKLFDHPQANEPLIFEDTGLTPGVNYFYKAIGKCPTGQTTATSLGTGTGSATPVN